MTKIFLAAALLTLSVKVFAGPCFDKSSISYQHVPSNVEIDVYTGAGEVILHTSPCNTPMNGGYAINYVSLTSQNLVCTGDRIEITSDGDPYTTCQINSMEFH